VNGRDLPGDWFCEGQTDLTDLVEDEYIPGSMPPDEATRAHRRQEFYDLLRGHQPQGPKGGTGDEAGDGPGPSS
jgi:hypothetical protein